MEITVGRTGNQKLPITDRSVSREHCRLISLGDGRWRLENLSANGTYVNGCDVIRTIVTPSTRITLGRNFTCLVGDLLPMDSVEGKMNDKPHESDVEAAFLCLEKVYADYVHEKLSIQQASSKANFMRTIPGIMTGVVFAVTMIVGSGSAVMVLRMMTGVASACLIGFSAYSAYRTQNDTPEKLETLNQNFQVKYICPRCGNFLGYLPFELLRNRNKCNNCKTTWIR